MKELISKKGSVCFLLGNEAIVRGALESGVRFVSAYPGTPSSEIVDRMYEIGKEINLQVEYAVNEKVSLETAAAWAACGLRSLCSMKHVGLNVAADAFMTLAYVGVKGGLVIVSADDPSLHSSQNEQDNRFYAKMALIPLLEPSTPQEAYTMTLKGFEISERYGTPCMIRTTTRVNHARGIVKTANFEFEEKKEGLFDKNPMRYVVVPMVGRKLREQLLDRLKELERESNTSSLNFASGTGDLGIITSGVSALYVNDSVRDLGISEKVRIAKLGMTFPFPKHFVATFLKSVSKVLVVEELEPFLEDHVKAVAQEIGWVGEIGGKGIVPRAFELNVPLVRKSIESFFGVNKESTGYEPVPVRAMLDNIPPRPPNLCPGCPHRATYYSVKRIFGTESIYPTDIGCYTLGMLPPLNMADFLLCMGSSVTTAGGFSLAQDKPVVAFVGDSTFFHAGIPGLINGISNGHKFILVIVDNVTTAMTGHQPNPGVSMTKEGPCEPKVNLEDLVKACGVKGMEIVNPLHIGNTEKAFRGIKEHFERDPGVYVVISRSPCPLLERRALKKKQKVYFVVDDTCDGCNKCLEELACPAFVREGSKVQINRLMCIGCAVCSQICRSIKPRKL